MIEIDNDIPSRTIRVRMASPITDTELIDAVPLMKRASDAYRGAEHMTLADMRGLNPLSPDQAALMGEAIAYQRRRGVVLCAHLSDSSIMRLQAKRLGREASPHDTTTIDVVSLDEAEKVLAERRAALGPRK